MALIVLPFQTAGATSLFRSPEYYHASSPLRRVLAYDWDRDGWEDLVVTGSDSVTVLLNNHEGRFGRLLAFRNSRQPYALVGADLNGDGVNDLIVGTIYDGIIRSYVSDGSTLSIRSSVEVGDAITSIVAEDFDEDGDREVLVARAIGVLVMLSNDGTGQLSIDPTWHHPLVGAGYRLASGDVNGDGHKDVMVASTNTLGAWLLTGDGTGGFTDTMVPTTGSQGDLALDDMDRDGILDYVGLIGEPLTIAVLRGNGNGSFTAIDAKPVGPYPEAVVTTDLDQDGFKDVVVGSVWFQADVYMNDGKGRLGLHIRLPTAYAPGGLAPADFDRNGFPDLAMAHGSTDTITVLLNANGGVTPVLVSAIRQEFGDGRLTLTWESRSPGVDRATVYRREGRDWSALGMVRRDALDRLIWTDDDIRAGASYGYRLGILDDGREVFAGEVTVTIPTTLEMRVAPGGPNPSSRGAWLSVTLPDDYPTMLSLWDVAGRRVDSRPVGVLGAGRHMIEMASGMNLAPGIYLARLERAGQILGCRVALIR